MNRNACHCGTPLSPTSRRGLCRHCLAAHCDQISYACGRPDATHRTVDHRRVTLNTPALYVADPHGSGYDWPDYWDGVVDALASAWLATLRVPRHGETPKDRERRRADIFDWALEMGAEVGRRVVELAHAKQRAWLASL